MHFVAKALLLNVTPCARKAPNTPNAFTKSCTFSMDSMQYNAEHCGINEDMDDEHSV